MADTKRFRILGDLAVCQWTWDARSGCSSTATGIRECPWYAGVSEIRTPAKCHYTKWSCFHVRNLWWDFLKTLKQLDEMRRLFYTLVGRKILNLSHPNLFWIQESYLFFRGKRKKTHSSFGQTEVRLEVNCKKHVPGRVGRVHGWGGVATRHGMMSPLSPDESVPANKHVLYVYIGSIQCIQQKMAWLNIAWYWTDSCNDILIAKISFRNGPSKLF